MPLDLKKICSIGKSRTENSICDVYELSGAGSALLLVPENPTDNMEHAPVHHCDFLCRRSANFIIHMNASA